ncbi:MAG: hypothetical protein H0U22_07055 [Geodermatophilaceae bacterium]|nr:hypothetical protein [Geodermatophilaceae bacterium]
MIVSGLASTGTRHPDLVGVRRVGEFASGLTVFAPDGHRYVECSST